MLTLKQRNFYPVEEKTSYEDRERHAVKFAFTPGEYSKYSILLRSEYTDQVYLLWVVDKEHGCLQLDNITERMEEYASDIFGKRMSSEEFRKHLNKLPFEEIVGGHSKIGITLDLFGSRSSSD